MAGIGKGLGQEITNLDFDKIIGAPLHAAVNAQADAAKTTIKFLQDACIDDYADADEWVDNVSYAHGDAVTYQPDTAGPQRFFVAKKHVTDGTKPGDPDPNNADWDLSWREVGSLNVRTINFRYDQKVQSGTVASKNSHSVTIPLMTMVPIPYVRIDEMNLEFKVKLNGVQKKEFTTDTESDVRIGWNTHRRQRKLRAKLWPTVSFTAGWARQAKKSHTEEISRTYSLDIKVRAEQSEIPVGVERMINLLDQLIMEDVTEMVND